MLRLVALLANIGWLGFLIYIIIDDGWPSRGAQPLSFGAMLATVVLNIVVAYRSKIDKDSLVGLWIEVKKAELRKRLT
jgi:hypothetical protein